MQNRHLLVKVASAQHQLSQIHAGVPQGSIFGPFVYLIYIADLPTPPTTTIATFADETAVLASDSDSTTASQQLQPQLNAFQSWLQKWRMQANTLKSLNVTFTTRTGMCPSVYMNNEQFPCADHVKYLGLHLDRKLTWHHIFTIRKPLGLSLTELVARTQIAALPTQQAPSLQNHPQINLDVWYPTLGHSIHIQH
jgi:hypothetical protein